MTINYCSPNEINTADRYVPADFFVEQRSAGGL